MTFPTFWSFCIDSVDMLSCSALTESMRSKTSRLLSQRWVRLHNSWANAELRLCRWLSQRWVRLHHGWVNADWDFTMAGSMRSETSQRLSQHGVDFMTAESMWSETSHWPSQRRVRLHVNQVNTKWSNFEYTHSFNNYFKLIYAQLIWTKPSLTPVNGLPSEMDLTECGINQ